MRNSVALAAVLIATSFHPALAKDKKVKLEEAQAPVLAPVSSPVSPTAPAAPVPTREVFTPPAEVPTVVSKVNDDWPKYDLGSKGYLSKSELAKWMADLRVANGEPSPDAAWQAAAFSQTDTNRDVKISKDELIAALSSSR
jgi:hypothetical protein